MRPWRPVLEEATAARAREAITAIADALAEHQVSGPGAASLAGGQAGIALLYRFLDLDQPNAGFAARAEQHIGWAMERVATEEMDVSLYGGFTGTAMAIELMAPSEDVNEDTDQALADHLALEHPADGLYELVSGWSGLAAYALERLPRPSAVRSLERIIEHLDRAKESSAAGITWHTPPEQLLASQRAEHPSGMYNLGLAHGVPGVIAVLAAMTKAGVGGERASVLLEGGVRWLLAQELPPSATSCFGYYAGVEGKETRTAWCYGDLGIAAVLLSAGEAAGRADRTEHGRRLAVAAARREAPKTGVIDAAICHGAAGMGLLLQRYFVLSGDDELRAAAQAWYARTLTLRGADAPFGGYRAFGPVPGVIGKLDWIADPCLLTGSAGIALALLAGVSEVAPSWDRLLLASLR